MWIGVNLVTGCLLLGRRRIGVIAKLVAAFALSASLAAGNWLVGRYSLDNFFVLKRKADEQY